MLLGFTGRVFLFIAVCTNESLESLICSGTKSVCCVVGCFVAYQENRSVKFAYRVPLIASLWLAVTKNIIDLPEQSGINTEEKHGEE